MITGASRLDARRWAVPAAMAMKAALALAFLVALDQLEGKGMAFRFPLFMLSAAVVPLVTAFHAWRFRRATGAAAMSQTDAWLLGAGIGALAIVGWEIAEWIVAETGAGGALALTYGDTVGDLALSTSGGMVGSWLGVHYLGDRQHDE